MRTRRITANNPRSLNGNRSIPAPVFLALVMALPAAAEAQFEYTTRNGGIVITRYDCAEGAVVIPSSINGRVVTTLGEQAFAGCPGLASVIIPKSVTSIESGAFSGCAGLTNMTIPQSVTNIGVKAFSGCSGLKWIEVEALNLIYSSLDGVLFDKDRTALLQYPGGRAGNYTLPKTVTYLGQNAFSDCTGLSSINIPNGLISIGYEAFSGCTGLEGVAIPNSVASIEFRAFSGCTGLTSVTIPQSVTTFGSGAFSGCASLARITIKNGVTTIPGGAFAGCHDLTTVTIPKSVTAIGYRAFQNCVNLSGVYFQGNAPASDEYEAFEDSDSVTVHYLPGTTGWETSYDGRPTALWLEPLILSNHAGFGVNAGGFGFTISWAPDASVVVESSSDLDHPIWTPISTNLLAGGSSQFTDPQWTDHSTRLYRLRTP